MGGPWHGASAIPEILHLTLFRSFSDAVSEEARELGLSTRVFDPDVFYEYLASLEDPSGGVATTKMIDH